MLLLKLKLNSKLFSAAIHWSIVNVKKCKKRKGFFSVMWCPVILLGFFFFFIKMPWNRHPPPPIKCSKEDYLPCVLWEVLLMCYTILEFFSEWAAFHIIASIHLIMFWPYWTPNHSLDNIRSTTFTITRNCNKLSYLLRIELDIKSVQEL